MRLRPAAGAARKNERPPPPADVCLVLEGNYPYITGGVSSWVHDIIQGQSPITFSLLCLHAGNMDLTPKYTLPENVVGRQNVHIQRLPRGPRPGQATQKFCQRTEGPLTDVMVHRAGLRAFRQIIAAMQAFPGRWGRRTLLNSHAAWDVLVNMYTENNPDLSFLDYFWSWRSLVSGLYAAIVCPLPPAKVYHAISTGYAGLAAIRAGLETRRPVLLTEHGLYTNERRVELSMANWLHESAPPSLSMQANAMDLRDLWINTFTSYARACYDGVARVLTLHETNYHLQLREGAPAERMRIIPNGVRVARYQGVRERDEPLNQRVTLIGRVVPIKDIASFIQACYLISRDMPGARFEVMGPTDEEPEYYERCLSLVGHYGLHEQFVFRGKCNVPQELPGVDVMALTSISESQPLTILEAGAAGIPSVVTDVGGCKEMIVGRSDEDPPLGPGGEVVPVGKPEAVAQAIVRLLTRPDWYKQCAQAMRTRVARYYDYDDMQAAYSALYRDFIDAPDGRDDPAAMERATA